MAAFPKCKRCGHDWHGLPCQRRAGWMPPCGCPSSLDPKPAAVSPTPAPPAAATPGRTVAA